MDEARVMISEAANRVDVEAHVLRYWQKELELPISRNEMEQRYYKESDIELLKKVKRLKEQGFQLKAIKMLLSNLSTPEALDPDTVIQPKNIAEVKSEENADVDELAQIKQGTSLMPKEESQALTGEPSTKLGQFKAIMNHIMMSALQENNAILTDEICSNVTDGVIREMNYLMRLQEEKEEDRFRKFDATLREYQKSKLMTAATFDKKRKKSKFMKKNKIYI